MRQPATRRGRPRDPHIEARILEATLSVYGLYGWAGFNFEGVAREAKVGKDALYRRWSSAEVLLAEAVRSRSIAIERINTGSLRNDMMQLGRQAFETFGGQHSDVELRLSVDAQRVPAVRSIVVPHREYVIKSSRSIIRRAIERGEVQRWLNPNLVMDMLIGSIINHVSATPEPLRPKMMGGSEVFLKDLVDVILAGIATLKPR